MQGPSTQISTEYLMTLHSPVSAPHDAGDLQIYTSPGGGWVKGPAIQGELVQPGGDWIRAMPNGTLKVDCRVTIRADDGSAIFMTYPGRIVVPERAAAQFAAGDALGPDDLYFMITPL